ncbi:carboxylesterase family protein [Ekhidna sp.]|uniref:carboxylesterase family protein n=1 Tax=Ekhidna sp. TaxID=2608089 RepID=UPI003B500B47
MKKYLIISLTVIFFGCSDDDGSLLGRYVQDVFADVDITFDIKYGEGAALVGPVNDLYLDVYEPKGDNETKRPLLLLAHGGAFISGTKNAIKDMCIAYAKKGYVVASMQYRLINDPAILNADSVAYAEAVVLTLSDMRGAIRYLRNDALNANTYGIDPNMIIIGGISAGGVMSMNVGFLDENDAGYPDYLKEIQAQYGGFEGNTNDINVSSEVQGIISYSGSVFRDAWIDNNDPPIFMVHDELDAVVPCNYEDTNVVPFPLFAYGSCSIVDALTENNVAYEFVSIPGETNPPNNHVTYLGDEQGQELINQSAEFINKILTGEI